MPLVPLNALGPRARKTLSALAIACLAVSASPIARAAQNGPIILVIAHRAVTVTALSHDELRLIFQTRRAVWPDGSTVRPFNLVPSERARQVFDRVVLGLTPELMPRYWIDRRIRGESHPPKTVPNDATLLKVIRNLVGSVGYVEAPTQDVAKRFFSDTSLKVIAKIVGEQVVSP